MTNQQIALLVLAYLSIYIPLIIVVTISQRDRKRYLDEKIDRTLKEAVKHLVMKSIPSPHKNEVVHKFEIE